MDQKRRATMGEQALGNKAPGAKALERSGKEETWWRLCVQDRHLFLQFQQHSSWGFGQKTPQAQGWDKACHRLACNLWNKGRWQRPSALLPCEGPVGPAGSRISHHPLVILRQKKGGRSEGKAPLPPLQIWRNNVHQKPNWQGRQGGAGLGKFHQYHHRW